LTQGAAKSFETSLDHVMRIFTRYRDVKIGLHMLGKRIKHMWHHIAWQITNMAFG
jgi:hypothetical protein